MKTEEQIRNKISFIQNQKEKHKAILSDEIANLLNEQTLVLRWVLGEQIPAMYYCTVCQNQHEGITCPLCGNSTLMKEDDNEANTIKENTA